MFLQFVVIDLKTRKKHAYECAERGQQQNDRQALSRSTFIKTSTKTP
ncbi:hypothetical protein N183_31910 [Sinorhizobium sp. Sb3]|nr:hypothetical protein N183_31910 [Sinorhizobium sp. Sb3]